MYSDLSYLSVSLPEDIEKLKWSGDFESELRVIDKRLQTDLPIAMKRRLEMEKEIVKVLPMDYPYTREEALRAADDAIRDFSAAEFDEWKDQGAIDWLMVNGEVRYKDDFVANLIKTRPVITARVKDPQSAQGKKKNFALLDETIASMKKKGSLSYHIRIRSVLTVDPDSVREGEPITVHLPLPVAGAQAKNIKILSTSLEPFSIGSENDPQRTVCFRETLKAGQEFAVEYEYDNCMNYADPKPEEADASQPDFCTDEQAPHIVFTPYLRSLTAEIVGEEKNPVRKARKIYDFVTTKVMYSFVRPYFAITNIPEYAAAGLKGDCGVQALLFITLCRCAGIPAQWQSGLYSTPLDIGCHDWARFYIAPYGWLFADCSFGGAAYREGAMERWNFYFGNLEPFRMPAASEFQHEFIPAKKFLRNDPYDNQTGEAEYEDRPLVHGEYKTEHTVLEIREI
jgi:hypothetical protein